MQNCRGVAVEARRPGTILLVALTTVLLSDQIIKALVRASMFHSQSIPVIEDVFHLTYVRNTGAAFGLMPGEQTLFIIVTALVLSGIALFWWRARPTSLLLALSLGLLAGGALGNMTDRLLLGRVTDIFDFRVFPVFNVADIGIVSGAMGLFVWAIFAPIDEKSLPIGAAEEVPQPPESAPGPVPEQDRSPRTEERAL